MILKKWGKFFSCLFLVIIIISMCAFIMPNIKSSNVYDYASVNRSEMHPLDSLRFRSC